MQDLNQPLYVIKSRTIFLVSAGAVQYIIGNWQANSQRNTIAFFGGCTFQLYIDTVSIFNSQLVSINSSPFVLRYSDFGDSLYKINGVSVNSPAVEGIMVETWTEERPTS